MIVIVRVRICVRVIVVIVVIVVVVVVIVCFVAVVVPMSMIYGVGLLAWLLDMSVLVEVVGYARCAIRLMYSFTDMIFIDAPFVARRESSIAYLP